MTQRWRLCSPSLHASFNRQRLRLSSSPRTSTASLPLSWGSLGRERTLGLMENHLQFQIWSLIWSLGTWAQSVLLCTLSICRQLYALASRWFWWVAAFLSLLVNECACIEIRIEKFKVTAMACFLLLLGVDKIGFSSQESWIIPSCTFNFLLPFCCKVWLRPVSL